MRQPFSQPSAVGRIAIALGGLSLVATGLHSILRGDYSYENWWGGLAFAPLAVLAGAWIMAASVFPQLLGNGAKTKVRRHRR
jgi:hypothetical protein